MAHEDIDSLIAATLEGLEERPRPIPHAQHILDQYAALVRDEERPPEPSGRVGIPIATPVPAPAAPVRSVARRLIARLRR
jgi:hypothetical protein